MTIARIGGDEFAILLPNGNESEVKQYIVSIQRKFLEGDQTLPFYPIQLSIGYAYVQSSFSAMEQLFHEADANMYKQKMQKKHWLRINTIHLL